MSNECMHIKNHLRLNKMTQKEAEKVTNIKTEFDNLKSSLQKKISLQSQHQLLTDDVEYSCQDKNAYQAQSYIADIIQTCKETLNYAQRQEEQMKKMESDKIDAERTAIHFLEQCDHWKQSATKAKKIAKKIKIERDELSLKLDHYQQNLSSENMMNLCQNIVDILQSPDIHGMNKSEIESKLKTATSQRIDGSENAKNQKLKQVATALYHFIANNEKQRKKYETTIESINDELTRMIESKLELEQKIKNKIKMIDTKSKEKNLTLQTLVKTNNQYLLESQAKIKKLTEERNQLSEHCGYWQNLFQEQMKKLKGLHERESDRNNAVRLQASQLSPTGSGSLYFE